MATFTNATSSKLSMGDTVVLSGGTITDVGKDDATLANIKYFYDKGYLTTTGTPYFTSGGIEDAITYKGVIDCAASPNYPAANAGHMLKVSVAGKIGGASGIVVEVGDILVCTNDSTASGTQAAVGAYWTIEQANIVGAVTGPASAVDSKIAVFDGTTGKIIKDSTVLVSSVVLGPATAVDSQIAVFDGTTGKLVKDSTIPVARTMRFKGVLDGSATPAYPTAISGDTYKITAGTLGGNVVAATCLVICVTGGATGDHAAVGANWVYIA